MVCQLSQCLLKEDAWPAGHLVTWPAAKWSQAGRRSAGQGAKFEAAGWEDAAVWRSNTVEKSASWFD